MGVPSLTLLLDLLCVKEFAEGFLYISKQSSSRLIFPTCHPPINSGRNAIFLLVCRNWEYNPADQEDTLGVPTSWTTPKNLCVFSLAPIGSNFLKSLVVSDSSLVVRFSGVQPDLSPEDEEVKRRLVRCHPRAYSELIRSNIPESSGAKPA